MIASNYAVLDNGGSHLKYGWAHDSQPSSMPNCVAKIQKSMQSFVGDEISAIQNTSQLSLNRPMDRGYLVNWNLEKEVMFLSLFSLVLSDSLQILQRVFDSNHMNLDHSYKTTNILFTIPPFCPEEIQSDTHEV
jgi:actin-related protein